MKSLLVALTLAVLPAAALAQAVPGPEVAGDWKGRVTTDQVDLPFVVHLGAKVSGDSPAENRFGIPGRFEKTSGGYRVTFESGGVLDANLTKPDTLEGTYSKDGLVIPLTLTRAAAK